jgi:Spy/CpxP family protein refolding chaperone
MKKSKKVIVLALLMLIVLGGAGVVLAADNGKWLGGNRGARQEQMKTIIENNDYNQWKQLMGNRGAAQKITEQNFPKFVEMHKLMTAGKLDEANKIRQELGLGQGNGQGQKMFGKNGKGGCAGGCSKANGSGFVDANKDGVCDLRQ